QPLELLAGLNRVALLLGPALERFDAVVVVANTFAGPELQVAAVRLRLDLALRGEPSAEQGRADALCQGSLGDQQKRLPALAHHGWRRDDPPLRRQQQRGPSLAGLERGDFVGDHALEKLRGLGPADLHIAPIEPIQGSGRSFHAFSVGTRVHSNGGESRRRRRRYSSRPTSPSPSYETALGPFRRCGGWFPKIARWSPSPSCATAAGRSSPSARRRSCSCSTSRSWWSRCRTSRKNWMRACPAAGGWRA